MVKVVQNTNTQPLAQIKIKQNPVKVIKVSTASEGNNQVQKDLNYNKYCVKA